MKTISLCMIVKNEEETLDRCLSSIQAAVDEVIVVDTGSTDFTKKIAGKYTNKIYDFIWKDDFSAARNYAFSLGTMDYLMWLDADDVIPEESKEKIIQLKNCDMDQADMIMMPYKVSFDEQGNETFSYFRERLVKNNGAFRFSGRVHEVIPPSGKVIYIEGAVEHRKNKESDNTRNLRIYEKMEREGELLEPRAFYYYGRELLFHGKYEKSAGIFEKFLEMPEGWTENKIDAARQLAQCRYCLGQEAQALSSLLKALEYDVPRGETCCDLGRHFMDRERYEQAVYWFLQALNAKKDYRSGAFIQEDCYGFLPCILLCVCYDKMGNRKLAEFYNEQAGKYKPYSRYYLANKQYFQNLPGNF